MKNRDRFQGFGPREAGILRDTMLTKSVNILGCCAYNITDRPVGMFCNYMENITLTRSETTVAGILAAAEELLVKRSYSEVSMNEIAEAAGVTKGALYHHFDSKEELYLAMMRRDLQRKKALFTHAIDAGSSCRERLRSLTRAFFSLPVEKRDLIKLVRRDISFFAEPARSELIRMYQSSLPEIIEPVMAQGIRDGELACADPRLLSWYFVAQVEIMLGKYANSIFPNEEAKIDFALDLFFTGSSSKHNGSGQ